MLLMLGNSFLGAGGVIDAAGAAAEGNMAIPGNKASFDSCPVLEGRVNISGVHVYDRGVIGKDAAAPLASGKADATVSEAIVHAAIVADMRSPIALVEDKQAT
jgi:hypothetical protein